MGFRLSARPIECDFINHKNEYFCNMQFAQPAALWGLFLALVPLIVHLFSFRAPRRVQFSNVSLLKEIREQNRKRSHLKHLVILACRTLAVILLVLAFARPEWGSDSNGVASLRKGYHSVFVDNSPSMSLAGEGGVLLEQAREAARSLAQQLPATDQFQLITHDLAPGSQRWLGRDEFIQALGQVTTTAGVRPLSQIQERQMELMRHSGVAGQVRLYWLGDFQQSGYPLAEMQTDTTMEVNLLQFSPAPFAHVYVDTAYVEQPLLQSGQASRLILVVRNGGSRDADDVRVVLEMEGAQKGLSTLDVPAYGTASDTIGFTPGNAGILTARLSVEESGLDYDRHWYMRLEVAEHFPLLHIAEQQGSPYVSGLFDGDEFIRCSRVSRGNIDYNALASSKAVILDGLTDMSSGLVTALNEKLQQGGSVVLLPAGQPDAGAVNALLAATGGGRLTGVVNQKQMVGRLDFQDPLYQETFERIPEQLALPTVQKYWSASLLPDDYIVMQLADRSPWLVRRKVGAGQLLVLLSAPATEWTDFPEQALWVPTLYRAVLMSGGNVPSSWRLGTTPRIELTIPGVRPDGLISLEGDQQKIVPQVRRQGDRLYLGIMDGIMAPGHYAVRLDGQSLAGEVVALNASSNESQLAYWPSEELSKLASDRGWNRYLLRDSSTAGGLVAEAGASGLWRWLLSGVLLFLLLEMILVRRIS